MGVCRSGWAAMAMALQPGKQPAFQGGSEETSQVPWQAAALRVPSVTVQSLSFGNPALFWSRGPPARGVGGAGELDVGAAPDGTEIEGAP